MSAPAWYGETVVKADEHALRTLGEMGGRVRQDNMLFELSRGYDTRRSESLGTMNALVESGKVGLEWDTRGYPFYVAI